MLQVRRTAEIAFGDPDNEEYIDLKNYEVNPHRQAWGWASNNSVWVSSSGSDHSCTLLMTIYQHHTGFRITGSRLRPDMRACGT